MRTFAEWLKENMNEEMPKGKINDSWFAERDLPMVVGCTCCGATMTLPSAMVDDDDYVLCHECAGE